MTEYIVGQRYLSEAEPELGLGRVAEISPRRVLLHFPASETVRQYASQSAPLKRVAFRVGDEVEDEDGERFRVESVEEEDGLLVYLGAGRRVVETELVGTLRFSKPEDRLLGGHWDENATFELRRRALVLQHRSKKSKARGFAGARIELLPHQLYISHEVASRPVPRALLADEVGLGKTIEAGLILHRLLRSGQLSRVLILVPEPLVHQWFIEMLRRFHLSFTLVNESFCLAVPGNPFLQTQTAIVSLDWVLSDAERSAELRDVGWDMVVVDEAHHLELSDPPSPGYTLVDALARDTRGLLLLTATPEQLGERSHFARLRLLDPDRYTSYERYRDEAEHYRHIAALASSLGEGGVPTKAEARELIGLLPAGGGHFKERLDAVLAGDESMREALLEDLLDMHGPGRVVFRNRKSVLDRVPERRVRGVALKWPSPRGPQLERLARELVTETRETGVTLEYDFRNDVRASWLSELLAKLAREKVLVLCRFKEKAVALHQALTATTRVRAGLFHEDLSLLERDRNAAWFADLEEGAQVLLCSEIGSEGRNFQFAHHLVLFDLPLSPELLEQRIGRLYRIGQEHTVEIHVPYLENSPEETLFRWYHEGLDAFEGSLPSGGASFEELGELVRELVLEHIDRDAPTADAFVSEDVELLIEKTRAFRDEVTAKLEEGRDRLLELGSFRSDVARSLIAEIVDWDEDRELDRFVQDVLGHYGVELEEVSSRTFVFRKGNQLIVDDLPGLRGEEVGMTSDRNKATHQGELDFLTWDHPMVTGVMELLASSEHGNSAVALLPSPGPDAVLLEAVFVLDTVAPPALYVDRFVPPTPVRIVVDQDRRDVTARYPAEALDDRLLDGRKALRFTDRSWQDAEVPQMIAACRRLAEAERPGLVSQGLSEMQGVMGKEFSRLKRLAKVNDHIRPEEVDQLRSEIEALEKAIASAKIRLDALRLIWKAPG